KIINGNEALAYGALRAGVKVVSGYPGTPSSEVIASLLEMNIPETHVEWSTNEKVAFEVAAGAALAGHRALCTMKMSGLNVCYDSLIGVAYSGCPGGLVVYVADDPGVSAGMCEQDTRGFAVMSDMPMLEPCSLQEVYDMTITAFELAEKIAGPVFLRLVTNNSQSHGTVEIGDRVLPKESAPMPPYDPSKYTKAGAAICMQQHRDLIGRLEASERFIEEKGLNKLKLGKKGGVGIVSVGITNGYVCEALERLQEAGVAVAGESSVSTLRLAATVPYAKEKIARLLGNCSKVLVVEELEGFTEKYCYIEAYKNKFDVEFFGKEDGTFSRVGQFDVLLVENAIRKVLGLPIVKLSLPEPPERLCAARPIGFCAGCPHRGTYMGLEQGLNASGYKKENVFITGDIGCTILGSCPPFDILWTELSMGASIPFAHGVAYSNIPSPVIATIGDSTFFHAGIPGLVNALQHNMNLLVVILDNGWTAMTGMQVNPGTGQDFQKGGWKRLDIEAVVRGLGVAHFWTVDAYNAKAMAEATEQALKITGPKVILSRRECAIQAARHKVKYPPITFLPETCVGCKRCIDVTGCPAISLNGKIIAIDGLQCNNCGLCTGVCPTKALRAAG
ncbi:MAG: indolepyruvate ferredoxin oxidoreductase subunit alpha, partial [Synergistaceae bacterium]|nr:indolepyruvate ferredoxin oxidoreductase subunit alpha [Synergistaceae bacterium]